MKHMRVEWRPMTQEPNIKPGTAGKIIAKWVYDGETTSLLIARDWEGNLHLNAYYAPDGTLRSTSEISPDSFSGWLYFPE